jgi:hypothetical protein
VGDLEDIDNDEIDGDDVPEIMEEIWRISVGQGKAPSWAFCFRDGESYDFFRDSLEALGSSQEECGDGEVIDLPWEATRAIVDEGFGIIIKEVSLGTDDLKPEVDVGAGLVRGEVFEMGPDADALSKVEDFWGGQVLIEAILTCEEDLDFWGFVET